MKLPEVGALFAAKYQLHAAIGEGGFAVVYRAEDVTIGRSVALKVLKPTEDGYLSSTASRFEREARSLAGLRDPHTVHLYEFGTAPDGLLYMAFELLDGADLSEMLGPRGTFDEPSTRHILKQVLASLREAHGAGLLHRDLKPSNIRIYEYMGDPLCTKLMDFGIARSTTQEGPAITKAGELVGTPRYMSPEQMAGAEMTAASDLYSLGMIAFEMLMGTDGSPLQEIASGRPVEIDASAELAGLINRLLRREAGDRLQSADAVLAALDRATRPAAPPRAISDVPSPSTTGEHRVSTGALLRLLGTLGALVVVCGFAVFLAVRSNDAEPPRPTPNRDLNALLKPQTPPPSSNIATVGEDAGAGQGSRDVGQDGGDASARPEGCGQSHRTGLVSVSSGWTTYVPKPYAPDKRHPLLLVFGGLTVPASQTMKEMGLAQLADDEGLIVVVANGGTTSWRGKQPLIREMAAQSQDSFCVDPTRIYALGHGMGGDAAELAACEPWLTAMATTSHRNETAEFSCENARPIPHLYLAPLKSGHLPLDGGSTCADVHSIISLDAQEALWRQRNHCEGAPREVSNQKGSVCLEWTCEARFMSCHIDGGHGWTDRQRILDLLNCDGEAADFPYRDTIWEFFNSRE